jgi:hypothetical protein
MLKEIFGYLLILSSLLDAWKYLWQVSAIKKAGVAKGHSRKFLDAALLNHSVKVIYGIVISDIFIIISAILALVTTSYNFYILYLMYPYKNRGLKNFKRPNIFVYLWNSLLPNNIRKHL